MTVTLDLREAPGSEAGHGELTITNNDGTRVRYVMKGEVKLNDGWFIIKCKPLIHLPDPDRPV